MNDISSKPTLGPAVFNKHNGGPYHGNITVYRGKNKIGVQQVRTVAVVLPYASADENDANAALIAEAFTVHHETGLTPQQLREQRDELLAALKAIVVSDQDYGFYFPPYVLARARAAIAKVEQSK